MTKYYIRVRATGVSPVLRRIQLAVSVATAFAILAVAFRIRLIRVRSRRKALLAAEWLADTPQDAWR